MCINKMIYYIEEILTQVIQCVKILLVYHLFLSGNLKKKNWKYISGSICLVLIAGIIMYFTENIDALAGRILESCGKRFSVVFKENCNYRLNKFLN